jgi:hypothetical protein
MKSVATTAGGAELLILIIDDSGDACLKHGFPLSSSASSECVILQYVLSSLCDLFWEGQNYFVTRRAYVE